AQASEAPIAAAVFRKDRRLTFIVSLHPGCRWRRSGLGREREPGGVFYARKLRWRVRLRSILRSGNLNAGKTTHEPIRCARHELRHARLSCDPVRAERARRPQ